METIRKTPIKPFNNYGWSKLGGETPCMIYDNSLILRIWRITNHFHIQKRSDMYKSLIWDDEYCYIEIVR